MRHALTALAMALPAVAFAQETTVGSMDGILDGRQIAYVIPDGEDIATDWRQVDGMVEVEIEAYPGDAPTEGADVLRLTFMADAGTREPDLSTASVEFVQDGTTLTATDDAVALTLDSLEISGDSLLLQGNLRTTM